MDRIYLKNKKENKVVEAPKKIYLYPSDRAGEEYEAEWGDKPWGEDYVEYTRTDTLEVKEVDLEKEMDFVKDAYYYFTSDERDSMMKVACHFFELGLKAQKGE